jgi:uncharacterized membrane protein YfcA
MMSVAFGLLVVLLCYLSLRRRVHNRTRALEETPARDEPVRPRPSPLADALAQLVGISGGVYIGFTALAGFLKLPVPDKLVLGGLQFDPVAVLSLLAAIIQPYFVRHRS